MKLRLVVVAAAALVAGLAGGGAVRAAAPANDDFANAVVLGSGGGTVTADNSEATKEAGEPDHAGDQGGKSVWYTWTPGFGGTASIDTDGSSFDTLLAVYTGASVSSLTTVASNDDIDESGGVSRVCFTANPGMTYAIAVDGYAGSSGSITLDFGEKNDVSPCPTLPPTVSSPLHPKVGDVLTVSGGTFADTGGAAPTYQWVRCAEQLCLDIDGATGTTYVAGSRDVGTALRVDARLTNGIIGTALEESAPTSVVSTTAATHANGRIFWVTKLAATPGPDTFRIDSMLPDGTSVQHVTTAVNPGWSTEPAVSPDGTLVAFVDFSHGGDVSFMNADGSGRVDLGIAGSYPTWSPDASRLAFTTLSGIDSIDGNGNDVMLLPLPSGSLVGPLAWSPDGTKIAFSYHQPGHTDLDVAVVSADGRGAVAPLTSSPLDDHDPSWSPTGDRIAFERGSVNTQTNNDLWVMNADGSSQTQVFAGDASHGAVGGTAWAPDGTAILFSIANGLGTSDLYTVPSGGGAPTKLAGDGYQNALASWGAAASYELQVTKDGSGSGSITSTPGSIACGATCSGTFADPTAVVLTATAAAGSTFTGWSGGGCSGTGTCAVTMLGDRNVTATFDVPSGSGGGGGGGGGSSSFVLAVTPSSQTVASGASASVTISVMNSGGAYLYAVGVRDSLGRCTIPSSFAGTASFMPPGVTISYTCSLPGVTSSLTNTVVATATTGPGDVLTQTASVAVTVQAAQQQTTTGSTTTHPVSHTFKGTARGDHLIGTSGNDLIEGFGGNDVLNGVAGNDTILGGAGSDLITGGRGRDKLFGGSGNDIIVTADGAKDTVDCGPGRDTVTADKIDAVAKNCEHVHRR